MVAGSWGGAVRAWNKSDWKSFRFVKNEKVFFPRQIIFFALFRYSHPTAGDISSICMRNGLVFVARTCRQNSLYVMKRLVENWDIKTPHCSATKTNPTQAP